MDFSEILIRYILLPLLTAICTMGWYMFKKHDSRLEHLENRTNESEKTQVQINTAFKYLSQDLQEIKDLIKELKKNG